MLKLNYTFNFATFPTNQTNYNIILSLLPWMSNILNCLLRRKFRNGFREMTQAQSQKKQAWVPPTTWWYNNLCFSNKPEKFHPTGLLITAGESLNMDVFQNGREKAFWGGWGGSAAQKAVLQAKSSQQSHRWSLFWLPYQTRRGSLEDLQGLTFIFPSVWLVWTLPRHGRQESWIRRYR